MRGHCFLHYTEQIIASYIKALYKDGQNVKKASKTILSDYLMLEINYKADQPRVPKDY